MDISDKKLVKYPQNS